MSINVDFISPKNASGIVVSRGKSAVTPTDDSSIVTKGYVDALSNMSSGTFHLVWGGVTDVSYDYIKPTSTTVLLTQRPFTFDGNNTSISAANIIPLALRPTGSSTTDVVIPVTDGSTGDIVWSFLQIPNASSSAAVILTTYGGYTVGTTYSIDKCSVSYTLVQP